MLDPSDAVLAAPSYHRLALENEWVRVLETVVHPGETVPMHTHPWPGASYILSWSEVVRRDEHGTVLLDTRLNPVKLQPGDCLWGPPMALHTLENVGDGVVRVLVVEVKQVSPLV